MEKRTTEPMAAPVVLDYGSPKTVSPRPPRSLAQCVFEGIVLTGVTALVGSVLFSSTHLSGAQRSVKIKWEQRQQEIQQAVAEQQADEAPL